MIYTRLSQIEKDFGCKVHYDAIEKDGRPTRAYYVIRDGKKVRLGNSLGSVAYSLERLLHF